MQDGIAGVLPAYRGTVDAIRCIIRDEGKRALYAGLFPALIGSGIFFGLKNTSMSGRPVRCAFIMPFSHLIAVGELLFTCC